VRLSEAKTKMEGVCGRGVCVTSSLPRSLGFAKSTVPVCRVSYQHLTPFPSQSHLFSYNPPPYAKTLRTRNATKPAIFLPHLIASLVSSLSLYYFNLLTLIYQNLSVIVSYCIVQQQVDQTYIMVKPDGVQRGLVSLFVSSLQFHSFWFRE